MTAIQWLVGISDYLARTFLRLMRSLAVPGNSRAMPWDQLSSGVAIQDEGTGGKGLKKCISSEKQIPKGKIKTLLPFPF